MVASSFFMATVLFLLQLASTLFMTGLICFVQVVHYPLFITVFRQAGEKGFVIYETEHARRTGGVVFPPMLIELVTALAALLPRFRPVFLSTSLCVASAALVLLLWGGTGLVQVPLHNRLGVAPDERTIRWLVRSNWLRTALWVGRSALLLGALLHASGFCVKASAFR